MPRYISQFILALNMGALPFSKESFIKLSYPHDSGLGSNIFALHVVTEDWHIIFVCLSKYIDIFMLSSTV